MDEDIGWGGPEPLSKDEEDELRTLNQIILNVSEAVVNSSKNITGIKPDPKLTKGLMERYHKLHRRK